MAIQRGTNKLQFPENMSKEWRHKSQIDIKYNIKVHDFSEEKLHGANDFGEEFI